MTKTGSKREFLCVGCRCSDSFEAETKTVFCKIAAMRIPAIEYLAGMKFEDCDLRKGQTKDPASPHHLIHLARIARSLGTAELRELPVK